ncbi:phosphoribosyl-AMP cyclohydrolase [archaeon]|jgi:histidyl-tRNA synthetase|nr:phosphoribosyl-AMP cyclohydrolase [archaeon]MBT3578032.1 phosphoribosyl-AMP cyclohydrolase [archaeon]MBT6819995.1 phosphoribosyl-AMP cyclohydrolase [archaeon]MBT6956297.1 phosphoribosyl-AMP cyclohydrolase [archaeon]MBT7025032.1 phosphoribosyl-AMP cyclohydrolase [archaeon]
MEYPLVKGFKEFTGEEARKREAIRKILVESFELYGFEPADAPVVEYRDFVKGDNESDEAVSDVFKLTDKGGRDLALRYEMTFQLKRLMQGKKRPYKRYAIGPVFRDEPVAGNRLRQFVQCDVDTVGSEIRDEAEVLAVVKRVLTKLDIEFVININNRKLLNEILEKSNIEKMDWNKVIKEIDKLDKLDEDEVYNNLRNYMAQDLLEIFKQPEEYFEKYEAYKEIKELKDYCEQYGVEVTFLPSLARGLSYYNGSVFEVKTKKIKETITAGGSFMFEGVQSTGLSLGLDRLAILLDKKLEDVERYMVLSIGQEEQAIKVVEKMRDKGYPCILSSNKISKALDYANSTKIDKVVFVGEKEVSNKSYKIKDLNSGIEKTVSESEILGETSGSEPDFSKAGGLVPTVVQDAETGKILMMAYMNKESWDKTLDGGKACYFSRSRNKLWLKGEESGNFQEVKEIRLDCDRDTILLRVNQVGGAACHEGYPSCFFREYNGGELKIVDKKVFNPEDVYDSTN